MSNEEIKHLIESREKTHHGIYSDIGTAIEIVSTADLFRYYMDVIMDGHDSCIRDFLENAIINAEVAKSKVDKS